MKVKQRCSHKDEGSALALVLILVTVLSTMLMSIAFLTQSASQSISQQSQSQGFKSDLFAQSFKVTLDCLTAQDSCPPGSGDATTFGSRDNKCDDNNVVDKWKYSLPNGYGTGQVLIQCTQDSYSGLKAPLASYMLVGTDCGSGCSEPPIVGKDGGLAITNGADCLPLSINGGILNSSGAWSGISGACNFSFTSSTSALTVPNPSLPSVATCPAGTFGVSCGCPTGISIGTLRCPSSNSFDSLNPKDGTSYVNAYLRAIANQIKPARVNGTFSTAGIDPALITGCTLSPTVNGGYGLIDNDLLVTLNSLTTDSDTTDGTGCPVFTIESGRFIFTATTDPYETESASWNIDNGVEVIGNADGVSLLLTNNAIIKILDGALNLTAFKNNPVSSNLSLPLEPTIAAGDGTGYVFSSIPWLGLDRPALTIGIAGSLQTNGLIFVPGGYGEINQGGAKFSNGVIFSGMTLTQDDNSFDQTVASPPSINGDRFIQLRFWLSLQTQDSNYTSLCRLSGSTPRLPFCSSNGSNLGLVQLQVKDYFGQKPGGGYQLKLWQAP